MPPTHSSWDHSGLPYGRDLDPARGYRNLRGRAARSRARTELFDDATQHAADPDSPLTDLGVEYLARVAAARAHATALIRGTGLFVRLLHLNPYAARSGIEFIAAVAILLAIVEFGALPLAWALALLLIVTGLVVALQVHRRDQLKPALIALDRCECPDCGYDLAGTTPGLPLERTNGVNVGPRLCPECGVPWPLVPPPCEP